MRKFSGTFLVLTVLSLAVIDRAQALSLAPGYDLWTLQGGSFIAFDPDGPGGMDPIPVPVAGSPIHATLYNTDTIIQRKAGADPFSVGDELIVPIEVVAMSLHGLQPVELDGTFYDVTFSSGGLLSNPLSPLFKQDTIPSNPDGSSTIRKLSGNGGTFDSFFDVFFEIELKPVNDPNNADKLYEQYKLFIEQAPWVETPGHHYPKPGDYPSGNFYAEFALADGEGIHLVFAPASTPEPATLVLMAAGFAGLVGLQRRNRL